MNTEVEKIPGQELVKRINLPGTPFTLVKQNDKTFLTMGKYQISDPIEDENIETYIEDNKFNIIATMIGIIAEGVVKMNTRP